MSSDVAGLRSGERIVHVYAVMETWRLIVQKMLSDERGRVQLRRLLFGQGVLG